MDAEQFRRCGKEMIDFVADYLENIRDRRALPDVNPGYLIEQMPEEAPDKPEQWEDVFGDIEKLIMPGVTHWHSPQFHAYFPTANSYPAIVADILSSGIACIGFSWISSPACTELEVVVMDWLAKAVGLPESFLSSGKGGGAIQGTASEATLVCLLGARAKAIAAAKVQFPDMEDAIIQSKLVAYTSDEAHSSVERACLLGAVKCRLVESDPNCRLRGESLQNAIQEDKANGLIPFYVVATLGTTPSCAFDALDEIGPVCDSEDVWLHVDAAYAGSAFICPEYQYLMKGVEYASSYDFNAHKWMLVNFDCSCLWFRDFSDMVDAFNVDPLYLKYEQQGKIPDYRHLQIPLGRRFRSLKLWFVMRLFGISGLQDYIRKHIALAHEFEALVNKDSRFEVTHPVLMGLVCFRIINVEEESNKELVKKINEDGRIHLVPSKSKGIFYLRLAVCGKSTESVDIKFAWNTIDDLTTKLLTSHEKE